MPVEKKTELNEKATLLKKNPEMRIVCIGHTCDIGSNEVNYWVGLDLAEATKAYLMTKGISSGGIEDFTKKRLSNFLC